MGSHFEIELCYQNSRRRLYCLSLSMFTRAIVLLVKRKIFQPSSGNMITRHTAQTSQQTVNKHLKYFACGGQLNDDYNIKGAVTM